MLKDLSYALRSMARIPGVTAIVVLTLALGIGATTAMFSVVNAVLLRPLPYKNSNRLVTIRAQIPSMNIYGAFVEYNTFIDYWRAQNHSFESMMSFEPGSGNLTSGNEPERLYKVRVNAGFLSMLGVKPAFGREFLPEEDRPGAPRAAMVSYGLWQRRFGGDKGLIGRSIVVIRTTTWWWESYQRNSSFMAARPTSTHPLPPVRRECKANLPSGWKRV